MISWFDFFPWRRDEELSKLKADNELLRQQLESYAMLNEQLRREIMRQLSVTCAINEHLGVNQAERELQEVQRLRAAQ